MLEAARARTRSVREATPEDRLLLHERAAARGMASATYVSVLLRAHLRSLAPSPKDELVALKHAVSELGAVGRNLNQIARAANQGARVGSLGTQDLQAILKVCVALRDRTKDLLKANAAAGIRDMPTSGLACSRADPCSMSQATGGADPDVGIDFCRRSWPSSVAPSGARRKSWSKCWRRTATTCDPEPGT